VKNFEKMFAISSLMIGFGLSMALVLTLPTLGEAPDKRGDYATAFKEFRPLKDKGSDRAEIPLSWKFEFGWDDQPDDFGAEKWNRNATEQRNTNAQDNPDFMHEKGRSAPRKAVLATARGDFRVQLGAFRSKARAVKKAKRLISLHKHTLGRLTIVPVRADLGSRGVYYRLRVGPFPDRATANSLCHMLSAHQQNCIMVKP